MKLDFESQPIVLSEKDYSETMWNKAQPQIFKIDKRKSEAIESRIQVLKSEIDSLNGRINHELSLTERITSDLKLRASDKSKLGSNEIKELERQWQTTENNLKVFKNMIEPKIEQIAVLKKEMVQIEIEIRLATERLVAEKIKPVASSVLAESKKVIDSINQLFELHKTLIEIHKESGSAIALNPVDIPEVFRDRMIKYCTQLIEEADSILKKSNGIMHDNQ